MKNGMQRLDDKTLAQLRNLVHAMHEGNGQPVPLGQLVDLAATVPLEAGVTVDFGASRLLGEPMVVLQVARPDEPAACLATLSRREREVVGLIADGMSNKQIAARLHIALATVKDHVHRILRKTGLPNRAAIAAATKGPSPNRPSMPS